MPPKLQHKIKIEWSPNFAYAIGLITSDGSLNKDERHINFVSKESEMINNFKQSLLLSNQVSKRARGGETEKKYFSISFGDKIFYKFLNSIGLWAKKSKTIQQVNIPDEYFKDFLRGLFDGDGSFHIFWDKRWPNSFGYKIFFYSASKNFLDWLKIRLTKLYTVKGLLRHHKGAGVYGLQYVKGDSAKLFNVMHQENDRLFLKRKYDKINNAIQFDKKIKLRLQNIKSFRLIKNFSRTSSSV
jgi:hypothetical protein